MKTRLVNYREDAIDMMFALDRPRITIGREVDNMIQLPHEKVSKHHGVLTQSGEGWTIEDLNSTNGILVNGVRVNQAPLKDRDLVKIGPFEFYFEMDVPAYDWVPSHIVELSARIHHRTVSEDGTSGKA